MRPVDGVIPRVVVLGQKGFLARRTIEHLTAAGIACRAVGQSEVDLTQETAAVHLENIFLPQDTVVFASALTPEHGRDEPTYVRNFKMIHGFGAALTRKPCAYVVYLSSDAVSDESDFYGKSHRDRETFLTQTCERLGIPFIILRCTAVYGAGDTHNSYGPNRFLRSAIQDGTITLFGEGEERRDHLYVEDLTRIIHCCLERRETGVLPVGSGVVMSFAEVADQVQAVVQKPLSITHVPRKEPLVHRQADITRLKQLFPEFQPTPISVSLKHMLDAKRLGSSPIS